MFIFKVFLITIFFCRIGLCGQDSSEEEKCESDEKKLSTFGLIVTTIFVFISTFLGSFVMFLFFFVCCKAVYNKIIQHFRRTTSQQQQQQQQQQVQQLQLEEVIELVVQSVRYRQGMEERIQNNGQRQSQNSEIIDRLQAFSYQEHNVDEDGSCTICLDDFCVNQCVVYLPCNHKYHFRCIKEWIQLKGENATCPICLSKISQNLQP